MTPKYTQFNNRPFEVHKMVYDRIKSGSKVLDIGCASGYCGRELQKKGCKVWAIEKDKKAASLAKNYYEKVIIDDLDTINTLTLEKNSFDYILFLDVLEHLLHPEAVLNVCMSYLKNEGKIIISTPNIAHISIRLKLLIGRFKYEEKGILDHTHLHFYTKSTLKDLIEEAKLKLLEVDYSADFGQFPLFGRFLRKIDKKHQYFITRLMPNLLSPQFVAICQKK